MPSPAQTLIKPVVLVGMMGAGKTAIGGAMARALGVPFLDSDEALVEAANCSIAEIFERDGEEFFRARESEVIARLLDGAPAVLSTGGGAYLSADNRAMIAKRATTVWLKADLALLWERVRHKTTRPLLRTGDPYATLKDIYEARTPIYAKADLAVEAHASYSIDQMAARVIDALAGANLLKDKAS
ncbi:shikimate kinase [Litoreibacter ponti]|uniref:Shikimate kinase n=1 Tax=Litoreibacter ponti TaxID=1510457 RepID=A0A2T6BE12_9RHOB|nr:shikimate kinase [Litoreibacter ponti]PTX54274.1 shikimate kinase [Litoreibacter ponti]